MQIINRIATIFCACTAIAVSGCARQDAATTTASTATVDHVVDLASLPGNTFKVTYKPETVVIDAPTVRANVIAVSTDGAVFAFGTADAKITALKAGDVVLFTDLGLRKVTAVDTQDSVFLVETEAAALTDAIEDGEIAFTQAIDFGAVASVPQQAPDVVGEWLRANSAAAFASAGASGSVKPGDGEEEGWHFTTATNRTPNGLHFKITSKKSNGGADMEIVADGSVSNFESAANIQIAHGSAQSFNFSNKNMVGAVDFSWNVTKPQPGTITSEKNATPINIEIGKWPLTMGGIPFILEFNGKLLVKPGMATKNQATNASFRLDYNGVQGFSMKKGAPLAREGKPGGTFKINSAKNISIAPFAFIAGAALPRIAIVLSPVESFKMMAESLEAKIPLASRFDEAIKAAEKSTLISKAHSFVKKHIGDKIKDRLLGNEAEAYVELVLLATTLNSGPLVLVPCSKTTMAVEFKAGYETKLLGAGGPEGAKTLAKADIEKIEPPGVAKCGS